MEVLLARRAVRRNATTTHLVDSEAHKTSPDEEVQATAAMEMVKMVVGMTAATEGVRVTITWRHGEDGATALEGVGALLVETVAAAGAVVDGEEEEAVAVGATEWAAVVDLVMSVTTRPLGSVKVSAAVVCLRAPTAG